MAGEVRAGHRPASLREIFFLCVFPGLIRMLIPFAENFLQW
jgi:hypothetical protein